MMLETCPCLRAAMAADPGAPIRVAVSENLVADVSINDARAAMQTWIKRIESDLQVAIAADARIFSSAEEIGRRIRNGEVDAAALNVAEYRPIADYFDRNEILVGVGASGPDEYLLLVKRDGAYKKLCDLRGRRLCISKAPVMCAAPAWLSTLLDEQRLGPAQGFFGSIAADSKISRVVLPVFFEQADACIASRLGFSAMAERNPQVGRTLAPIATSATLVTCFYAFRKNYRGPGRDAFINMHKGLLSSAAGRQLAALFQFDAMAVRDAGCLASSLSILDKAERLRAGAVPGGRRGPI
jgi:hypothetical protein